jgi:putative ABC transport system permease protein
MIKFLLKGILRDKSRSFLPIIIIAMGVSLTVLLSGYMRGAMGDMIDQNARFDTGHVKVMSRAYAENKDQLPNDLALLGVDSLIKALTKSFPNLQWIKRIRMGGLLDAPNEKGDSKGQGPTVGLALSLIDRNSGEAERLNIESSLVTGRLPTKKEEAILGHDFAQKLNLALGDKVTYMGNTMNGSMTFKNFVLCGTIRFGVPMMDRGAMIIDVADAQDMLDMNDGAGEIVGFLNTKLYDNEIAEKITETFNANYNETDDEFAPLMQTLKQQNNLAVMLDYADSMSGIFVMLFVMAMSVVLWNTGLLGGLRRYKEFGIRLALGESKNRIYSTLIIEAVLIGLIGSVVGTFIGLMGTYYLQVYGIDISGFLENSTMLMPSVIRAKITPELFFIGFIPGVLAMVFGNMLSGMGIYRRETASLFKELEV